MPTDVIQWFPGHMAKTRRLIQESLPDVDIVIELADARIPRSSRNPEIRKLVGDKPLLTLYNKAGLADKERSKIWLDSLRTAGENALFTDCRTGEGIDRIYSEISKILAEKIARYREKGMKSRRLKAMIVGIPNVGKSTLINTVAGEKKAKAENRPGVTMTKQWVATKIGIDLLDMPGILWPRFDDRTTGENLAVTGAIRDEVLSTDALSMILCRRLADEYPDFFATRYKLKPEDYTEKTGEEIFYTIGRKRGFLLRGGEIDTERTSDMLLTEFRAAKIGRMTLEMPEEK